ncbi:fructose bisphosphate aldolase [Brooklawnia cerclae]|uniref:fructose-bisphosphate aldolase n=1 Tax=Brooklawnia cerclae TaxID=349934 RepID=A0ABX0SHD3_9ACTN|nr:fructose bisphosphate aldolase [Brooklawnia cerclae]NIH56738.1 fructose-bisphosphate aldolase class I [Brooklawnia cerclae]
MNNESARADQAERMHHGLGFIAALDQSGGSTPKALRLYGIGEDAYGTEEEMFDLVHAMRTRIMTAPSFTGDRILAAILFEKTMDRQVDALDTADYLWNRKHVVPILKVDKGLAAEADGVRLMKPMPRLDDLLDRAVAKGIFGTKMRSFVSSADDRGIVANVAQQFEIANRILAKGLVPIVEPEVDIHAPDKADAEKILKREITRHLDEVPQGKQVMLKLSIPSVADFYAETIAHPRVMRVVALSGGYTRDEANTLLARNHGMIASFSRALTQGLTVDMSDEQFDAELAASIDSIYQASIT